MLFMELTRWDGEKTHVVVNKVTHVVPTRDDDYPDAYFVDDDDAPLTTVHFDTGKLIVQESVEQVLARMVGG